MQNVNVKQVIIVIPVRTLQTNNCKYDVAVCCIAHGRLQGNAGGRASEYNSVRKVSRHRQNVTNRHDSLDNPRKSQRNYSIITSC